MKYWMLALLPCLLVIPFAATAMSLGPGMYSAVAVAGEVGKVLSLTGALVAAFSFGSGDYLRTAWLRYGACYIFLGANDLLGLVPNTPGVLIARGVVVAVGNASAAWGTWMLARAWTVAGLEEEGVARRRKEIMFVVGALLSLAVTGWPLVTDVGLVLKGDPAALVSIASDIGDILTLALIAPVMHTALAMRGGLLIWPWGLLTLSNIAWVAYDASSARMDSGQLGPGPFLVLSESIRIFATGWVLAAGIAQRFSVSPEQGSPVVPAA